MRIAFAPIVALLLVGCGSTPSAGPLGEGMGGTPRIVGVDTGRPPRSVTVALEEPGYAAVVLVAPGHSATVIYPRDSTTDNRLAAGSSVLPLEIPRLLVRSDSALIQQRRSQQARLDSVARARARSRVAAGQPMLTPLPPNTPTFFLLLTSPQPLVHRRLVEKTAGVSIPLVESEALNAVGKAIRSTIAAEPRSLAGFYQMVELSRP